MQYFEERECSAGVRAEKVGRVVLRWILTASMNRKDGVPATQAARQAPNPKRIIIRGPIIGVLLYRYPIGYYP